MPEERSAAAAAWGRDAALGGAAGLGGGATSALRDAAADDADTDGDHDVSGNIPCDARAGTVTVETCAQMVAMTPMIPIFITLHQTLSLIHI